MLAGWVMCGAASAPWLLCVALTLHTSSRAADAPFARCFQDWQKQAMDIPLASAALRLQEPIGAQPPHAPSSCRFAVLCRRLCPAARHSPSQHDEGQQGSSAVSLRCQPGLCRFVREHVAKTVKPAQLSVLELRL